VQPGIVVAIEQRPEPDLVAKRPDPLAVRDGGRELPAQPRRCLLAPLAEGCLDEIGRGAVGGGRPTVRGQLARDVGGVVETARECRNQTASGRNGAVRPVGVVAHADRRSAVLTGQQARPAVRRRLQHARQDVWLRLSVVREASGDGAHSSQCSGRSRRVQAGCAQCQGSG